MEQSHPSKLERIFSYLLLVTIIGVSTSIVDITGFGVFLSPIIWLWTLSDDLGFRVTTCSDMVCGPNVYGLLLIAIGSVMSWYFVKKIAQIIHKYRQHK